jgi:putative ABC transport system permease protein
VAYALIALVLAVLITASVVAAAVVASYRRIGVLKSVGFTPAQVAATYVTQLGIPAIAGVVIGTLVGNWWVLPLLNGGAFTVSVPLWINVTVPLGMLALTGVGALVPALRAGQLPAVAAIAAGQAPRAGHGYAAHRLAAKLRLPRPVTMGLAAPFTRPSRSAVTLATLTFGLTAVVLAVGLNTSIAKINSTARQYGNKEIIIPPSGPAGKFTPSQERAVAAMLGAQPDTQSYVAQVSATGSVPGLGQHVPITAYQGNAARLGWQMVSGRWYHAPGEAVINAAYPTAASLSLGQTIRMTVSGTPVTVRITGQAFVPGPASALFIGWQTLSGNGISLAADRYIAVARPGVSGQAYQAALDKALGTGYKALSFVPGQNGGVGGFALVDTSLIRLLTLLVAVLAGLGVLNTVLMSTRERVHDLGVVKALGMTPRQTIAMVTCWILAPAVGAAIIGLPAGMSLQNTIINAIGRGQTATGTLSIPPGSLVHVYTPGGLALLALAGLAIAIIGALGPATWAAVTRTTTALRAE